MALSLRGAWWGLWLSRGSSEWSSPEDLFHRLGDLGWTLRGRGEVVSPDPSLHTGGDPGPWVGQTTSLGAHRVRGRAYFCCWALAMPWAAWSDPENSREVGGDGGNGG